MVLATQIYAEVLEVADSLATSQLVQSALRGDYGLR